MRGLDPGRMVGVEVEFTVAVFGEEGREFLEEGGEIIENRQSLFSGVAAQRRDQLGIAAHRA